MTKIKRHFVNKILRVLPSSLQVDKRYAEWRYRQTFGHSLNLENPQSFNEKIQWLNLYNRKPEHTVLADKFRVRDYVSQVIGPKYLIELLGVYSSEQCIDFEVLPEKFVLRMTHGSGWNILCPRKEDLDIKRALKKLRYWLRNSYYKTSREWVYRDIQPRIVAEKFIETPNHNLLDYKFFCFQGEPLFIQVDINRFTGHTRLFYNSAWIKQPFGLQYPLYNGGIPEPPRLSEMLQIASSLAGDSPFCRIDLYVQGQNIIFGEITFFPESGLGCFFPAHYDYVLGELLDLSAVSLRTK